MALIDLVKRTLQALRGDPPVATGAELADFVDRRASFLAQKCVTEFCRVRAGVYWQKLFDEEAFRIKLNESCWESYAPSLAMILEVVDAHLRQAAGLRQRALPAALERLGAGVLDRYKVPDGAPDDFRERQLALIAERMRIITGEPARPVHKMASPMARIVYDNLPIHKEIVKYDYDYILNNLRMNLVRAHEDFLNAAQPDKLVEALIGKA